MTKRAQQRANLRGRREFAPQFGARHPVVWDTATQFFLTDVGDAWTDIIPARVETDVHHARERYIPQFSVYDDPNKVGMSVLERRVSTQHARKHRLQWNPNDVGRIRVNIENEIARLGMEELLDSERAIPINLSHAVRVGDPSRNGGERKIAIIAEQASPAAELLVREHEIIMGGLAHELRGFRYPHDQYVPKMTIGRVFREVDPANIDACVAATEQLLPRTVRIEPIMFFAQQELR